MTTTLEAPARKGVVPSTDSPLSDFNDHFLAAIEDIESLCRPHSHSDAIKISWIESIVGPLLVGVQDRSIGFIQFAQQERLADQLMRLQRQWGKPLRHFMHSLHVQLEHEMLEYCEGRRFKFTVPIKASGTTFQQRVWEALLEIPYGHTWSYEQLATAIGQPTATRAVGLANGANNIAIVVPCHRVINKNGQLGGYGGGQWRKQRLLDLEQQTLAKARA